MSDWILACACDDIDEEDLIRWDHNGHAYAIYNTDSGFYCTDGMCTHEEEHLEMESGRLRDGALLKVGKHTEAKRELLKARTRNPDDAEIDWSALRMTDTLTEG